MPYGFPRSRDFTTIQTLAPLIITFGTCYITTPILARRLISKGITGIDIHKPTRPLCAEMGGLAVLLGFAIGILTTHLLILHLTISGWAAVLTVAVVATIGALDDLIQMRQRYKPILVALATLPLILTYQGSTAVWLPFIGPLDFGGFYLVLIPLMITTLSNFTNMHAGFNGLEAGVASISLATLGASCFIVGVYGPALIALILAAAYTGFLRYNWFPAKVFPGDVATLTSGAAIAAVGILAKLEFVALLVSIPAATDFTLKMLSKRPFAQRCLHGDSIVTNEGFLRPAPYPSLSHAFMKVSNIDEKGLVKVLLLMEAVYAALALALVVLIRGGYL